jgi:hypothetical protein
MAKKPKLTGRPSDFSQEAADEICDRIGKGESLAEVCSDDWLPHKSTVYRWLGDEDNKGFRDQYAQAREAQADGKFDKAWQIASAATAENVQVARLQVDTIKWQASKLAPKKYGEKVTTEHTGEGGGPINVAVKFV